MVVASLIVVMVGWIVGVIDICDCGCGIGGIGGDGYQCWWQLSSIVVLMG